MKMSYEDHSAVTVLTLSGELTADQSDAFRRAVGERFEAGIRHIVMNLEHLTLVDSAGLEMMLWLIDETTQRSGQLRLVKPEATVKKILEITRLQRRFNIHESIESAAKSLR
jgi:stage II sporulation protein AA (anti-sigma F factor antagonist)